MGKQDMESKAQTFDGEWWVPASPNVRAFGKLEINEIGTCTATLNFTKMIPLSTFLNSETNQIPDSTIPTIPRLCGQLYSGKIATLEQVHYQLKQLKNGIYTYFYTAKFCIISDIDFKSDLILLDTMVIEAEGLDQFIDQSGFTYEKSVESIAEHKFDIKFQLPEKLTLRNKQDLKIEVLFGWKDTSNTFSSNIVQTTKLKLSGNSPKNIGEWRQDLISIKCFLSLMFDTPLALTSIQSTFEVSGKQEKLLIYFDPAFGPKTTKTLHPHMGLIKYDDDKNNIGELLYKFMEMRSEHELVFGSFFAASDNMTQYLEMRFFLIVRALESFHRHVKNQKKKIQAKQRFSELFRDFDMASNHTHNWESLVEDIVCFRNQEAHVHKSTPDANNYQRMVEITVALRAIFAVLFMDEIAKQANFNLSENWVQRSCWVNQKIERIGIVTGDG